MDREVTPSIEPDVEADDIPALPSNDEEADFMVTIKKEIEMDNVMYQTPVTMKKEASTSTVSLPPFLQHSDTEDEPMPDPSPYEEEERVKKEKIIEIIKEIEHDEQFQDDEMIRRLQSERRRDMNSALDGMFDDDFSITMDDSQYGMSPRGPIAPSPRPNDSDLIPLEDVDGFPIVKGDSPTPPPPELGLIAAPHDDMQMSSDLVALLDDLSASDEDTHWNAP